MAVKMNGKGGLKKPSSPNKKVSPKEEKVSSKEEKPLYEKKKHKVAIVGYAPSSRMLAPFDDKDYEIWGVNELYKIVPRVDVLFEIHQRKYFQAKERNPEHLKFLRTTKMPIFMIEHLEDIPMSIPYPIDKICKYFDTKYFTNSISYMFALAIYLRFDEIATYGVDMATDSEYGSQRPSCEYFLGIAKGIYLATGKCKTYIPPQADLLKSFYLYGYQDEEATDTVLKMKARLGELQGRVNQYENRMMQDRDAMNQMLGAKDDVAYWLRTWDYSNRIINKNEG